MIEYQSSNLSRWVHKTPEGIFVMDKISCARTSGMAFYYIGVVPYVIKTIREDHTAAAGNDTAEAAIRRRRIPQKGFFRF